MNDQQKVISWLRRFNDWRDEVLIELSIPLLMLGFIAGTVDAFTRGGLSGYEPFTITWAIIQAVAIDGLFFAVWGKVAKAQWSRATIARNGILMFVGVLLAVVAILVNGLLSYQELYNVSNVQQAMQSLHIDQTVFTYSRSFLVVFVSILVALFCRGQKAPPTPVMNANAQPVAPHIPLPALPTPTPALPTTPRPQEEEDNSTQPCLPSVSRSPVAATPAIDHKPIGLRLPQKATPQEENHRERIKKAMLDHPNANYVAIAEAANVGYSTVKKHAASIRQEIGA